MIAIIQFISFVTLLFCIVAWLKAAEDNYGK